MNEEKRLAALELVKKQHQNINELLVAGINFPDPFNAILEGILYHCKTSYKVLELMLEESND